MLFATISYIVCLVGIILMYIWYAPQPTCLLNIFFITWTLVLVQLMTSVALHPKVSSTCGQIFSCSTHIIEQHNLIWNFQLYPQQVNAGILTPGLMGLYVVFLCWCAIRRQGYRFLPNSFALVLMFPSNAFSFHCLVHYLPTKFLM